MDEPFKDIGVVAQNFKCFGVTPRGFDTIKPINIAIGRNNSGKSTLLDIIAYVTRPFSVEAQGHLGEAATFLIDYPITESLITQLPTNQATRIQIDATTYINPNLRAWGSRVIGKKARYNVDGRGHTSFREIVGFIPKGLQDIPVFKQIGVELREHLKNPFLSMGFRRIAADRDIVPEGELGNLDFKIGSNGDGVTQVICGFINYEKLQSGLIENVFLKALNEILWPDAEFSRIIVQKSVENNKWEIHLVEDKKGRSIPLSRTGSGLKTVMLVLTNLLVIPAMEKRPLSEYLFAFEELENNLHPAAQRRLFRYLRQQAETNRCHFFLTTHSNVVIDLYAADSMAQLLHVSHDRTSATVTKFSSSPDWWRILDDLDVRASDLLQTNAVIWVEGPSDRIYVNRWLELWSDGELIPGVHFQCLPYGGAIATHFSFDDPDFVKDMIAALKINKNAIFIADSDRRNVKASLKANTIRLVEQANDFHGIGFVTDGREVENYIPLEVWRIEADSPTLRGPNRYGSALEYARTHLTPKPTKVELATRMVPHFSRENLASTLDLGERLQQMYERLKVWNRL